MNKKVIYGLVALLLLLILGTFVYVYMQTRKPSVVREIQEPIFQEYTDAQLEDIISKESFAQANFGGKAFVSFKRIGEELQNLDHIIYMWVLAEEYYKENGILKEGSGTSLPIVLHISGSGTTKIVVPRDGSAYTNDIKRLFPENKVDHDSIFNTKVNSTIVKDLKARNTQKAQEYFK
ncbi:MAG: hypothetical protein V4519_02685 [Patescibacteria group bacterium]